MSEVNRHTVAVRLDGKIQELGVQNAYFPCFVSQVSCGCSAQATQKQHKSNVLEKCLDPAEEALRAEEEHVEGFAPEAGPVSTDQHTVMCLMCVFAVWGTHSVFEVFGEGEGSSQCDVSWEVAWVTKSGTSELTKPVPPPSFFGPLRERGEDGAVQIAIRPTSETIMCSGSDSAILYCLCWGLC